MDCPLCALRLSLGSPPRAFDAEGLCAAALRDPSGAVRAAVGALVFSAALPPSHGPTARATLLRLCASAPGGVDALAAALAAWGACCAPCGAARAGGAPDGGGALSLFSLAARHVLPLLLRLPHAAAPPVCTALWRALLALPAARGGRARLARQAFAAVLAGWLGPCATGSAGALGAMGDALASALPLLFSPQGGDSGGGGGGGAPDDLGGEQHAWLRAAALSVAGWGGAPLARTLAARLVEAAAQREGAGDGAGALAAGRAALGFSLACGALSGEDMLTLSGGQGAPAAAPLAAALAAALEAAGAAIALGDDAAPLAALRGGAGAEMGALVAQPLPFQQLQCACPACYCSGAPPPPSATAAMRQDACLRLLLAPPALRASPAWAVLPPPPAPPPAPPPPARHRKRARRQSDGGAGGSAADWASLPPDCLHAVLRFLAPHPPRAGAPPPPPPLHGAPPPFLREHALLGRAVGALAATCGSWRDATREPGWQAAVWASAFRQRWELHGERASVGGAGPGGRPLRVAQPPPLATPALPARRLLLAAPLPPGHLRCLCDAPPPPPPFAPPPPTHEWAAIYRARAAAQAAALREERRAAATRAQCLGGRGSGGGGTLLKSADRWAAGRALPGAAEARGGAGAGALLVCDVCTCAALFPSRAAAAEHLKAHHGLRR
jgi:hypothetical protein